VPDIQQSLLISAFPAGRRHKRVALAIALLSRPLFLATLPIAHVRLARVALPGR